MCRGCIENHFVVFNKALLYSNLKRKWIVQPLQFSVWCVANKEEKAWVWFPFGPHAAHSVVSRHEEGREKWKCWGGNEREWDEGEVKGRPDSFFPWNRRREGRKERKREEQRWRCASWPTWFKSHSSFFQFVAISRRWLPLPTPPFLFYLSVHFSANSQSHATFLVPQVFIFRFCSSLWKAQNHRLHSSTFAFRGFFPILWFFFFFH